MMSFLLWLCLFLVVTPLCAAPAASPTPRHAHRHAPRLRPVTSSVLVKRDSESPGPGTTSRFTCDKQGIYADQDTGCQVTSLTMIFKPLCDKLFDKSWTNQTITARRFVTVSGVTLTTDSQSVLQLAIRDH